MVYLFLAFDIYLGSTVLFENDSSRSIVRFLLIEYTISPRPPLLSPTNFRNSEQSTTRGNRPLLETIRSSSTILFPLHTDRGAFRLSGVRTLGERSGQRAALRVLETPLLRSRSSRSWFILNVAERIELIRFRETVGKNITRIYIYISYLRDNEDHTWSFSIRIVYRAIIPDERIVLSSKKIADILEKIQIVSYKYKFVFTIEDLQICKWRNRQAACLNDLCFKSESVRSGGEQQSRSVGAKRRKRIGRKEREEFWREECRKARVEFREQTMTTVVVVVVYFYAYARARARLQVHDRKLNTVEGPWQTRSSATLGESGQRRPLYRQLRLAKASSTLAESGTRYPLRIHSAQRENRNIAR